MKHIWCDCVNPAEELKPTLDELIDSGEEITGEEFFKHCEVNEKVNKMIDDFPNDFTYWRNGNIYWFEWSNIEHFFK